MDWKNQLTKTPYLVLFIVLISIGVGTASAAITITLAGNVHVLGDLVIDEILSMTGGKIIDVGAPTANTDAATKGYVDSILGTDTLAQIGCTTDKIVRFDGTNWVCVKLTAKNNPTTIVDSTDKVGGYSSIAIGADNNPVISYYESTNGALRVAHCGNTTCTSGNIITTIDSTDFVGLHTSIAIGADNNPVISYYRVTGGTLKVVICGNTSCSSENIIRTLDGDGDVGRHTSIAIGTDNNPVISYFDDTNDDLKVIHCGNPNCGAFNTITTVDSADSVGGYTSIAIGTDGNPVISYRDGPSNHDLKVVHCSEIDCSDTINNTITTVDTADQVGFFTSIAIGTDGNPVISYQDTTNNALKVVHCSDTFCSDTINNTITTVDSIGDVGYFTSITINTDGNPVISYTSIGTPSTKVVHCGNISCSFGNVIRTVDEVGIVGGGTSIAIGSDGNPVISYLDGLPNWDLRVAIDGVVLNFE